MKRLCTIIFFLIVSGTIGFAQSPDLKEFEARKARIEKEIATIDKQLSDNASRSKNELTKLNLLRAKADIRKADVSRTERQIRRYNDEIYSTQRQINVLQAKLDTLSDYYSKLVRSAYKNRDAKVWYMYLIASENLGQAFRRFNYFKNLSAQVQIQADKIRETQDDLETQKTKLNGLKSDALTLQKDRRAELQEMEKEEKEINNTIAALKKNKSKYEKELKEKRKQVQALDKEIQRLIQETINASKKIGEEIDYKLADEFSKNKGKLPWPASGAVVDRFGQHNHPVFTNVKLPFNNGITIAVAAGTEARAVFNGVVKQIVVMPGYNQCVLVQHGNYFSFYCKLKTTSVRAGDVITTGQKIGTVDTINGETQLHFQIWQGNKPQNPEAWLRNR